MKKILIVFLLLPLTGLLSQTIHIDWQGVKSFEVGEESVDNLPFFTNEGYWTLYNVPRFGYTKETAGPGRISLQNIQYSYMSPSELGGLNTALVPSELEYFAKVDQAGDKYFNSVSMIPFVKEGNRIKKVTSFQIVHQSEGVMGTGTDYVYDPADQSVLRSGTWYKIRLKKSGIFKLDKAFFDQNGIPSNFDPRTLKIYGNGGLMLRENPGDFRFGALQQNAIKFVGEEDGSFDSGDYVLFYAQGPNGWTRSSISTLTSLTHRTNEYSDYAYYFITFGGQPGKRIQTEELGGNPVQVFNRFDEFAFHEIDSINLNQLGKQWGGEALHVETSQNFTLQGNAPVANGGDAFAKYRILFKQAQHVIYNGTVNGEEIGSSTVPSFSGTNSYLNNFQVGEFQRSVDVSGSSFVFNISIDNSMNPGAFAFLDYIEIKYQADLVFNGSQMQFRRLENLNDGQLYGFSLSGPQEVWNISNITSAVKVANTGGVYKYRSTNEYFLNEFIAFNENAAFTEVEYVGTVPNQNIRAMKDVDYAIVAHPDFLGQASRLANFRIINDGVKAVVVTTEQVYNEFGSGSPDLSAIRDFFKHLRDTGSPLKYVMLFGGASYDYKDRILNNTNFVPTYIGFASTDIKDSYSTDDFFAMLDDTDIIKLGIAGPGEYNLTGSAQMDIAVGRMPAHDVTEARIMVDKTLAYYEALPGQGTSFGDWKTRFLLVVDDDIGAGPFHTTLENTSAQFIENSIPYATLRKGYLDSFPLVHTSAGYRYPQVNQLIENAFNLGTALLLYFGHGGPRSWSQSRVITYEEISNFKNFTGLYSRLPVVMTITCEFTVWDIPSLPSAGVLMYKVPQGGAVAMVTTSRPVGVNYGEIFNENLVEQVLKPVGTNYQTLGEALTFAKVHHSSSSAYHKSVNLLGDPMVSVTKPQRQLHITKINGEDADTFDGLFRALDFVTIEGEVMNAEGTSRDHTFNGKASGNLFDKPVHKSTLNNGRVTYLEVLEYEEQVNAIAKIGTNVENGRFKFQFYIPKDINYEVGMGKFTVYASNNMTDGVTTKHIKIGDLNPDGLNDDKGPAIGLYMNNLNFVDGGITNRNPYLLACLVDESGINTSGVAIGHDITAVLDQDVEGTFVLNEYYEGGDNNPCTNPEYLDYQKGQVMYGLSNLSLGEHQILFKAWDINNNSSEQTLDFVVMEEGSTHIYIDKLLNWPNPFTNQTFFQFEHNCDSELEVMVQIFTVSGKLVKTIRQHVTAEPWREGYRTGRFAIPWDGLDDFGDKIGKGVYIYRLIAKGSDPEVCKGSATAVEKLVILK